MTTMSQSINLQLGWPSKSLFPTTALHNASTAVLLNPSIAGDALIYGPDPGYQPLRESLGSWLTNFYKPRAGPVPAENLFIGNGASATLGIVLEKFTDPGYTRRVFMIEPTYFLACPIFEDAGFEGRLKGVPEDEEGIDVEFLRRQLERSESEEGNENGGEQRTAGVKSQEKYPKLYRYVIYAVPTFSNPSGKVMSLRRRRELVELARHFDALVVTDDVYDMLRWPVNPDTELNKLPPPPPRLVDLDREMSGQTKFGNTVSNGSFSKLVGPGMRVSWAEGTAAFTHTLSTHGATKSGGSPSHFASVMMDQMLRNGDMVRHISEVLVPVYRKRYAVLIDAIKSKLEPLGVEIQAGQAYEHEGETEAEDGNTPIAEAGGFFVYIALPDDVQPAQKVAKTALDAYGLKFANGSMMLAAGDADCVERAKTTFGRGARLSWSWHTEDEIVEGVERLALIIRDIRAGTVRQKKELENGDGSLGERYT